MSWRNFNFLPALSFRGSVARKSHDSLSLERSYSLYSGDSTLTCPARVFVDIIAGDQFHWNQNGLAFGFLPLQNIVTRFDRFLGHHKRILSRGRFKQALLTFQSRNRLRISIHSNNTQLSW